MKDIFKLGLKRPIKEGDIYATLKQHKSAIIVAQYQREWDRELKSKKPNFLWCILRMYWFRIVFIGTFVTICDTAIA